MYGERDCKRSEKESGGWIWEMRVVKGKGIERVDGRVKKE